MGSFIGIKKVAAKKLGISYEEYQLKTKTEKWCTSCKSWRLRSCFGKDKSRGDGMKSKCFSCSRVVVKKSTKGRVSAFKGKKHSEETRRIISESVRASCSKPPMLGKSHSLETRLKISAMLRDRAAKGDHCHSYKDGKVNERRGQRFSRDYKRWRFDVFARDKFSCQKCGDARGGNLNAHHIKGFAEYPEFRFDIDNGVTLCEKCHKKEHEAK